MMEVDCAAGKLVSNGKMQEGQHPSTQRNGADSDCTSYTCSVVRSSRDYVPLPCFQKASGLTGLVVPSRLEADQLAPRFTNDRNQGVDTSSSLASDSVPPTTITSSTTVGCADASCRHYGSCLPSSLSETSRNAPEVLAAEQSRTNIGAPTLCTRTALRYMQTVDVTKSENGRDLGSEGRIYWGRKRGPYDRPVRVLLNGDLPQSYSHSVKEEATLKCRISEEQAGDEEPYAVTAADTMQIGGGEPESSSSMASTSATTPVTRTSNGSSSSTSSVAENPSGVAVVPSLAAAPSVAAGVSDPASSPEKQQTQAIIRESHAVVQAPRRRLVRLCDNDEEIWNEWEGQSMLGEGVYGRVYLVRSRKTGEERAFKRMYLQMSRFASSRSNESAGCDQEEGDNCAGMAVANGGLPAVVQREIASLKALQGVRNVIPLEEVFIGSRRVYLSFPVVRGGSLTELLRRYAVWQEHLLALHQTAPSACTAPSPTVDPRLPITSTVGSCEFAISAPQGCLRQASSDQCCDNNRSDCRDSSGVVCPGLNKRACCHTSRWDCCSSSSGRRNCSSTTNRAACNLDSHTSSNRGCRCHRIVAENSMQGGGPCFTANVLQSRPCSKCWKEEEGSSTHTVEHGDTGQALAVDSAALAATTRTGCHCSAIGRSSSTSIQLQENVRRSSTYSGKKEDEYLCCGSHACEETSSSSLPASISISASVGSSLTQCRPTAAAACCCCCCSTLHHGKEEEFDNSAVGSCVSASCSTCTASSSSRSSCLSTTFLHSKSPSLASSRSFFSPPFSFPQMPPCGLPLPLAKSIVQAILRGIAACHERRIAHRDMKPDNILLDWVPQAPPSPPPPPPSPVSGGSTCSCYSKQMYSCADQTRCCCTTLDACCTKQICYTDKQSCCNKQDNFSSEEACSSSSSSKRICCCTKRSCHYSKQVCCCQEAPLTRCNCITHMVASEMDESKQPSGPAAAAGNTATGTLDVGAAAKLLLLRNAQAEGNDSSTLKLPEHLVARVDTQAISENGTTATGKADNEKAGRGAGVGREDKPITERRLVQTMNQHQENAERRTSTKDESVVCSRKREPAFCAASGEEGENADPRRRKCTEATSEIRKSTVDATTAWEQSNNKSVAGAPAAGAGGVAPDNQTAAGLVTGTGEGITDRVGAAATQARGGTECDRINSGLFGSSAASVEVGGSSCAPASLPSDSTSHCVSHSDVDMGETAVVAQNHAGAAAVEVVELAEAGMDEGWKKTQGNGDKHSEAIGVGAGIAAELTVASATTQEEEEGDAISSSTSSSKTAIAEQEEEASSDTQQSEDSSDTPEYPPLPTRLLIADFGLARTLPFPISLFSSNLPLRRPPPSCLRTNQQQCLHHIMCQRTQFVLPATAAVPSTRCTSSCGRACWVGYDNSDCSGACCDVKAEKGGVDSSETLLSHAASISSAKPATERPTSPRKEGCYSEGHQAPVDKRQCRCKRWRGEVPGETNWQQTTHNMLKMPCDGSAHCSSTATAAAAATENACRTWWVHCKSASTTTTRQQQQQQCADGAFCCFCGQDASRTRSGRTEPLPADVALLPPLEGVENNVQDEMNEIEETQEEELEEEGGDDESDTSQLVLPAQSSPPYSSANFCLSPEIITLNYRPLDVLLGSSSYALGVDIWSVGCIFMELLTGCELIDGCTEFQCIVAIMRLFGNPWKKTEERDAKVIECRGSHGQARRGDDVTRDTEHAADCSTSSSSCCEYFGDPSHLHGVTESCASHCEAGKKAAPSEAAAPPAATTTCCTAQPAASEARHEGKLQSARSATRKRALRGRGKAPSKSHMDKSREWRFWSEALPAFQGEDRPLERILRENGRLDAVADPHLLDFASRLLTVLPDRRITASEALLHPFFDDVRVEDQL